MTAPIPNDAEPSTAAAVPERGRRTLKAARGSRTLRAAAGAFGAAYVRLFYRTARWTWVGRDKLDAMFAGPAFIGAVWHARLTPIAMLRPKNRRAVALVSNNRDGDLIDGVVRRLGGETVRGSSRNPRKAGRERGGGAAAQSLVQALGERAIVVITPDGPRGPAMRAKIGVAQVAAQAGVPVLPVGFSARWAIQFSSWDRFLLPLPFSRAAFVFGEPVPPADPGDADAVLARLAEIEDRVTAATREADRLTGRATPPPGPPLDRGAEPSLPGAAE